MEAMNIAWMQLSFDSSKDDIEEFINKVKNLAKRLGYNEQAQVMAIKNHLPLELYHNCLTIDNLKDLTNFLVKVYDIISSTTMQGWAGSKSSMYTGTNPSCKDVPGRTGNKAYSCSSCSGLSGGGGVFKS